MLPGAGYRTSVATGHGADRVRHCRSDVRAGRTRASLQTAGGIWIEAVVRGKSGGGVPGNLGSEFAQRDNAEQQAAYERPDAEAGCVTYFLLDAPTAAATTIAEHFLAKRTKTLAPAERDYLQRLAETRMGWYRIDEVYRDRGDVVEEEVALVPYPSFFKLRVQPRSDEPHALTVGLIQPDDRRSDESDVPPIGSSDIFQLPGGPRRNTLPARMQSPYA